MTLSQKVRYIRAERLLSQQGFADEIGVSYSTVSRWEREYRKPQARAIGKLIIWCKKTGIGLSDVEDDYENNET